MLEIDLKSLLLDQFTRFNALDIGIPREALTDKKITRKSPFAIIISGLRRVGKSTLLAQIAEKYYKGQFYFVNFDDERFINFSASDFEQIEATLIELFGKKKVFIFDEIQNVKNWEVFCRRLIDNGCKLFISGSNASLLSKELGTRLTGRYLAVELLPFSFREYLRFMDFDLEHLHKYDGTLTTTQTGEVLRLFNDYVERGGIPLAIEFPRMDVHKTLYENVIFRDIVSRYDIKHGKELRELALYLLSNTGKQFAYNKLKGNLGLGSMTTVKNFVDYLSNSWLFFVLNSFRFSLKDQTGPQATKKIYSIDTGMINSIAFKVGKDKGRLLENVVFLELIRRGHKVYFYRTKNNLEVDFYLEDSKQLIQVCSDLSDPETEKRELKALVSAAEELKVKSVLVIVGSRKGRDIRVGNKKIHIVPAYKWLLKV